MKLKKYILIPLVLFIYVTCMVLYFIPKSTDSTLQKTFQIVVSYALVVVLFFVLRYRERLKQERLDDIKKAEEERKEKTTDSSINK